MRPMNVRTALPRNNLAIGAGFAPALEGFITVPLYFGLSDIKMFKKYNYQQWFYLIFLWALVNSASECYFQGLHLHVIPFYIGISLTIPTDHNCKLHHSLHITR